MDSKDKLKEVADKVQDKDLKKRIEEKLKTFDKDVKK